MVNKNGYHHTKTEEGWRLTHHIIAERSLGRALKTGESVRFIDGDRANLDPKNLVVIVRGSGSLRGQIARLDERIRELQAQREELVRRLKTRQALGAE